MTTNTPLSRRAFLGATAAGALAAALAPLANAADATSRKPNFVIILADDLGYADLGCFGSATIATPHLDRMAAEGTRFTDFYSASPVCTPTRAGLLTGCYPARVGLARGVLFPNAQTGLNPDEVTVADMLKPLGYATACIGKWHLGDAPQFLPTKQGFDYYFGIPYSNDMRLNRDGKVGPPLMRNDQIIEHPANQATLTERYTQEAVKFITENKDKPFLLYLPHTMPHVPLFASEKFTGKSKGGLYGDVVETIDWGVGQILDTLRNLGLDENTLVIFTSDNGPWLSKKDLGGSAKPLRDGKQTVYEGGMRVPTIARWPGRVPAGKACTEVGCVIDLLPTLATLAGTKPPADRMIDGRDLTPLLTNPASAKSGHEALFYYATNGNLAAIRAGQWKLHLKRTAKPKKGPEQQLSAELYDLAADIGETTNLAEKHPEVVARLQKLAETHAAEMAKNSRPVGKLAQP